MYNHIINMFFCSKAYIYIPICLGCVCSNFFHYLYNGLLFFLSLFHLYQLYQHGIHMNESKNTIGDCQNLSLSLSLSLSHIKMLIMAVVNVLLHLHSVLQYPSLCGSPTSELSCFNKQVKRSSFCQHTGLYYGYSRKDRW